MDDSSLLVRYLLARSDVVGALAVLAQHPNEKLSAYIERFWPQLFSREAYAPVYEEAGKIEAKVENILDIVRSQARYRMVRSAIQSLPPGAQVLDFGCSRGAMDILLANEFGGSWLGVDIDSTSIEQANVLKHRHAKEPDKLAFSVGDEGFFTGYSSGRFDVILCLEVLEHVLDPWVLFSKLEAAAKVGGRIILTMPYGPVEYDMWISSPMRRREHIREWGPSDMLSIFGHKKNFELHFLAYGNCSRTGLLLGTQLVSFMADLRGFRELDLQTPQHLPPINVFLPGEAP